MTLKRRFPNIDKHPHQVTSERTGRYNCIAWAAGDDRKWWEPDENDLYYWPPEVPREMTLEAYTQLYQHFGYLKCPTGDLEPGFEKIAIYVDKNGVPTHAARQKETGLWTSKLGKLEDLDHELECLSGSDYGHIAVFMKRAKA